MRFEAQRAEVPCSDTTIWTPDIVPENLHDEVAVSFRAGRFLLALRGYSILGYYRLVSIAKLFKTENQ